MAPSRPSWTRSIAGWARISTWSTMRSTPSVRVLMPPPWPTWRASATRVRCAGAWACIPISSRPRCARCSPPSPATDGADLSGSQNATRVTGAGGVGGGGVLRRSGPPRPVRRPQGGGSGEWVTQLEHSPAPTTGPDPSRAPPFGTPLGAGAQPVESDGAGRRHVERVHLWGHGNAHVEVGQGEGLGAESPALGAEKEGDATGPRVRADGHGVRARGEREDRVTRLAQPHEVARPLGQSGEGEGHHRSR